MTMSSEATGREVFLLQLASRIGGISDEFRRVIEEVLSDLRIPDAMVGAYQYCNNLDSHPVLLDAVLASHENSRAGEVLALLIQHRDIIQSKVRRGRLKCGSHPIPYMESHPGYCMLVYSSGSHPNEYALLQSIIYPLSLGDDQEQSRILTGCRAVRQLSEKENASALWNLVDGVRDESDLVNRLERLIDEKKASGTEQGSTPFIRLIRTKYEDVKRLLKNDGRSHLMRRSGSGYRRGGRGGGPPRGEIRDEWYHHDLESMKLTRGLPDVRNGDPLDSPLAGLLDKGTRKACHARLLQPLAESRNAATAGEMSLAVSDVCSRLNKFNSGEALDDVALCGLAVEMLVLRYGFSIPSALSALSADARGPASIRSDGFLRFHCFDPERHPDPSREAQASVQTTEWFDEVLPQSLSRVLNTALQRMSPELESQTMAFVTQRHTMLSDRSGMKVTFSRLTRRIRAIYEQVGADEADCMLLGIPGSMDARWAGSYTAREPAALVELGNRARKMLIKWIGMPSDTLAGLLDDGGCIGDVPVGSRRVPLAAPLHRLIKNGDRAIGDRFPAGFRPYSLGWRVRVLVATGARGNTSVLQRKSDIAWSKCAIVISDKDQRDRSTFNTRLVQIDKSVLERFSADYLVHWRRFCEADGVKGKAARRFADDKPGKPLDREEEVRNRRTLPGLMPTTWSDGRAVAPTNGNVMQSVRTTLHGNGSVSEFCPNLSCIRHFVRSHARRDGVSGYVLNAALGHGSATTSPTDRFSMVSVEKITAPFASYTHQLIERLEKSPETFPAAWR